MTEPSPLDPPSPIPHHLHPQRVAIGPEDMRLTLSTLELRAIAAALDHDGVAGQCLITQRDGSPWVEVDAVTPVLGSSRQAVAGEVTGEMAPWGTYRYAIWRYTGKVYHCDRYGAVEDDPIDFDD
jgi:hypothetical protein